MGLFLLSNLSLPPLSSPPITKLTHYKPPPHPSSTEATASATAATPNNKTLTQALCNGVSILLSFSLLFPSPPSSLSIAHALDSPSSVRSSPLIPATDNASNTKCREDEEQHEEEERVSSTSQVVTNEGIVEEAWEIVYDSYLDTTNRRRWSPETWLQKKVDVLGTSYQTRSKAHDVIRRMLASLGDPYTRFLTPAE